MPNHISNKITVDFSQTTTDPYRSYELQVPAIDEIAAIMKTENYEFDFNILVPYPEAYKTADELHKIEDEYNKKRLLIHC